MSEKLWYKVARTIVKAGAFPFPITDTLIEFLQTVITEEQAKFLLIYKKPTLTLEQIKAKTDMNKEAILKMLNALMDNGIVLGSPSRNTGIMVYRLMGPYPGIFEYSLLKGLTDDKHKKVAELADKLFDELGTQSQKNYESVSKLFKQVPAVDRTVPVEKEVEIPQEVVLPYEEIEKYLEDYEKEENNIAVAHCYCRHQHDLLNDPCKLGAPKLNCFLFDKSAKFAIERNFASPISKEDAMKIFREAEDYGLVHKVFHIHSDPKKGIEAICNCCKCCCGILGMYHRGVLPLHTISSYISRVNEEDCVGCGTCVEKCPLEAIDLEDSIATVNEELCIGCGVCAHLCPEEAIHLERIGPRDVFIPLKKIATN
ncbi:MAG: 4Fe-4S dicluster domain-containing protein [Promethearchaeota archaeon]|nr:MAG: 4Fe-4S dicluster domain-containing protein [Candidatus Lokiarchaeota archaeon]